MIKSCRSLYPIKTMTSASQLAEMISTIDNRQSTIDNKLRFDDHVSSLCKKASQKLYALARISTHMCSSKLKILMKPFILSHFGH